MAKLAPLIDIPLTEARVQALRTQLIEWYEAHQRDLPWRRTDDPYAIWVSEIMLQQTQVETVKPYYHRFLEAFPTVEALATADEAAVLKRWEGLGYYSRARNLHRGAQGVMETHGGQLPETVDGLRTIHGIGPYTAGAIASIAFGRAAPILDGNVARVLSRVFHLLDDPKTTAGRKRLWALAARLVPEGQASAFNQGMMELGALVCVPGQPRCERCPLEGVCEARAQGDAAQLPTRAPPKPRPHLDAISAVVQREGKLLVARRPRRGLLGGMWECPLIPVETGGLPGGEEAMRVAEASAAWRTGFEVRCSGWAEAMDHTFTHLSLRIYPALCEVVGGELSPQPPARPKGAIVKYVEWRWVSAHEMAKLPKGRLMSRLLEALDSPTEQLSLFLS